MLQLSTISLFNKPAIPKSGPITGVSSFGSDSVTTSGNSGSGIASGIIASSSKMSSSRFRV